MLKSAFWDAVDEIHHPCLFYDEFVLQGVKTFRFEELTLRVLDGVASVLLTSSVEPLRREGLMQTKRFLSPT